MGFHASSAPFKEYYAPGQTKEPGRIFTYTSLISVVNIGKYTIHGCYGQAKSLKITIASGSRYLPREGLTLQFYCRDGMFRPSILHDREGSGFLEIHLHSLIPISGPLFPMDHPKNATLFVYTVVAHNSAYKSYQF